MISLKQIADHIAGLIKQPYNIVLKEQVKFTINYYRAEFIKNTSERRTLDRKLYQSYVDDLILVDAADNCLVELGCEILKTKRPIPDTIITTNVGFKFLGSLGRRKHYIYTDEELIPKTQHNTFTSKSVRYFKKNGHVYIVGNTKLEYVEIDDLFVNPYEVKSCTGECLTDDKPYPIPADMLRAIVNGIVSGEYRLMNFDDKESKLEKE